MKRTYVFLALLLCTGVGIAALPKPLVTGLKNPESVVVMGGKTYISVIGDFGKDTDGAILVLEGNKAVPFCTGLDDPKGMVAHQGQIYVTDKTRVWRINLQVKKSEFIKTAAFPKKPLFLNDIAIDPKHNRLYISDSGDLKGAEGKVFSVSTRGGRPTLILDTDSPVKVPNGLSIDEHLNLLVLDFGSGSLYRVNLTTKKITKLAPGFGGADGLTFDMYGRLYISDWKNGKLFVIPREGEKPVLITDSFTASADTCLDASLTKILVPDMKAGTLTAIPAQVPGQEVDMSPIAVKAVPAFPKLKWTNWSSESPSGKVIAHRPIVLTHAGDGSNRVFVATQRGVLHSIAGGQNATKSEVVLDIQDRVTYNDRKNEEGLLGLAFHPKFKQNGEIFIYYTKKPGRLSVVSRFRLSKDNPKLFDPKSEEQILTLKQPAWNHNGGTLEFGPDGMLYIAFGDGGGANDIFRQAQNTKTWLGSVLRIDVDHKDEGKNYAIPKDNPFVGKKDVAPETWVYGIRNIWRLAFDRKTGECWAGEVGQNIWEEINILKSGGNYGWPLREAFHPFGAKGVTARKDLIDPIWEYHHDLGKSITGGVVYRGSDIPKMDGMYIYADYVSGRVWALRYDKEKGRVTENRVIDSPKLPILSFGEDEKGEAYFMTYSTTGQGIYRLVQSAK